MAHRDPGGRTPLTAVHPAGGGPARPRRAWPLVVRRAVPDDRDAVLAFTSTTFDGWDYIADVWETWVADALGVLLVAAVGADPDGAPPTTPGGESLDPGRIVGVTHLAMLSATEAWIEGIRVDPAVRGLEIATDLQAEVLRWARDLGATVVRYLTGERNEGSLRLGARHGLLPVGRWRFHGRGGEDDRAGPEGRAAVEAALAAAAADGTLLQPDPDTIDDLAATWFARIAADPTHAAGHGLYEPRSWAYQSLTQDGLAAHLRAGEVLALGPDEAGHWALLIISRSTSLDDGELWPALLVGEGGMVIRLLDRLGGGAGPLARVRLPDPAPLLDGHGSAMGHLGYAAHEGRTVVVERRLG